MTLPISIPTTRVSDLYVSQRLISQVNADQTDLSNLEAQLSSGKRITLPSQDPMAAERIINVQRLIARNTEASSTLSTTQSYLNETDSALGNIQQSLTSIRAAAIGVVGSTATDAERAAAAQDVQQTIQSLVQTGNQQFNGRYLFAGTDTGTAPFQILGSGNVAYLGNDQQVSAYADVGQLITSSVPGTEVFGNVSTAVQGLTDLQPTLSGSTSLADLNGGQGIDAGKINVAVAIPAGTYTATIDLSQAHTLGDVARLIQNDSGLGNQLQVSIGSQGLNLNVASGSGMIYVTEEGGNTASSLGILTPNGASSITGSTLKPTLTTATPLANLLGTQAQTVARFSGTDNDIVFHAATNGTALNGAKVQLVDDSTVTPGHEFATYTLNGLGGLDTATIHVAAGASTAAQAITAANRDLAVVGVQATLDPADNLNGGQGKVTALTAQSLSGGSGRAVDLVSGLQIVNNGQTYNVSLAGSVTVEDLLNKLNGSQAGVLATINSAGTGINIQSRVAGADFAIGENGGTTGIDVGVRSFTGATLLKSLNYGAGIGQPDASNPQTSGTAPDPLTFSITTANGTQLAVNLQDTSSQQFLTVGDVINAINSQATQQGVATFHADLATNGNGIELTDTNNTAGGKIVVNCTNSSNVAMALGLVPSGQQQSSSATGGSPLTFTGRDVNPSEASGVFNSLLRLQTALQTNDNAGIERAINLLDSATSQVTFTRAELGSQLQGLDVIQTRQAAAKVQLEQNLSNDQDVDYATAASEFTSRQIAYQAALQTAGAILKMTLLNYL